MGRNLYGDIRSEEFNLSYGFRLLHMSEAEDKDERIPSLDLDEHIPEDASNHLFARVLYSQYRPPHL